MPSLLGETGSNRMHRNILFLHIVIIILLSGLILIGHLATLLGWVIYINKSTPFLLIRKRHVLRTTSTIVVGVS